MPSYEDGLLQQINELHAYITDEGIDHEDKDLAFAQVVKKVKETRRLLRAEFPEAAVRVHYGPYQQDRTTEDPAIVIYGDDDASTEDDSEAKAAYWFELSRAEQIIESQNQVDWLARVTKGA